MNDSTSQPRNGQTPTKVCTKCNETLPATLEYFYKHDRCLYGVRAWCKKCHARITAPNVRAWERANPERAKATQKRSASKNGHKYKERLKNRPPRKPVRNLELDRISDQRKRARKRALPATFTAKQWQACLEYFHHTCVYCGAQQDFWHVLEQEHFIPVTAGGGYIAENIIPACKSCNSSKCDAPADQWLISRHGKRKAKSILARIETYFDHIKRTTQ